MSRFCDVFQTADWTKEKHVPVIDCPDSVAAGEFFDASVTIGKEIAHPNTTEHHIRWMALSFLPEGGKFVHEIARIDLQSHGESVDGPNQGPAYTNHSFVTRLKISRPGTLFASSYCNIHGLWESTREIRLA